MHFFVEKNNMQCIDNLISMHCKLKENFLLYNTDIPFYLFSTSTFEFGLFMIWYEYVNFCVKPYFYVINTLIYTLKINKLDGRYYLGEIKFYFNHYFFMMHNCETNCSIKL